jgi:sulfur-oxidizing protein SoxA
MKTLLIILTATSLAIGAGTALASPEQDRQDLINYFTKKYPNIPIENYVYGALAYDQDAMDQYKSIMDFPPFLDTIDKGRKMWETPFKNGKTYAECLPNGGKNIAGNYPYFDDKANKVVTLEDAINNCRVANGEEPYKLGDAKTIGTLESYMRTLSDGMLMNIKVEGPAATAAYEEGKKLFFRRAGQLNFACASCHIQNAGLRLRSEYISPAIGQAVHWPVFRGGENLLTLQDRYKGCFKTVRAVAPPEGSAVMNDMEYWHSYISNGLPMKASVFRK